MQQVDIADSQVEAIDSKKSLNFFDIWQKSGVFLTLGVIVVIVTLLVPTFASLRNLTNVTRQASIDILCAIGMTFVILCGEIDLSIGATFALSGTLVAGLLTNGINPVFAVICGLIVGALIGTINGLLVAKGKVASFIATLGTMTACRGLTLLYTGGYPISGFPESFLTIGRGDLWGIPLPTLYAIVATILAAILLRKTRFGRRIYSVGGNSEAAWVSGIDVDWIKINVFALSGLCAAVAGIMLTSRLNSADALGGSGAELNAIAAVVLGGASLSGGVGYIVPSVIGVLIMATISNGLNLAGVEAAWQNVTVGLVIVAALLVNSIRKKSY